MKKYMLFKIMFVMIILFSLFGCATVQHIEDFLPTEQSSIAIFRVNLDHDPAKSDDFEKYGYMRFDLIIARYEEGKEVETVHLYDVSDGWVYALELTPGIYTISKGNFSIGSWRERYVPGNVVFIVLDGVITYSGDINIVTKIINSSVSGNLSSFAVSTEYTMHQYVSHNEKTIERFKKRYPTVVDKKKMVILNK